MFSSMIYTVAKLGAGKLRNAAVGAALLGLPTAAFAHHRFFHPGIFIPAPAVVVDPVVPVVPFIPAPAVAVAPARVWVEPVYQTVTDRVWVPAVTQTQVQQVQVPAEYGYREVVVYGIFGRHIHHEQVLICPARCESRPVDVVVTPGHFEMQTHQVLVTEGHWQDVQ